MIHIKIKTIYINKTDIKKLTHPIEKNDKPNLKTN